MHPTLVTGIDPGLVHTGVVDLLFVPADRRIEVETVAIVGPDVQAAQVWINKGRQRSAFQHIYIEGYRPRSNFGTDTKMVAAVQALKAGLPTSTILLNHGVKKVVKQPLMELLGVWKFGTVTHHQDLRSAARIALFGMLKQEPLNRLLTTVVRDHLEGRTWDVQQ